MNKFKLLTLIMLFATTALTAQNPLLIPGTLSGNEFHLFLQNGTYQFYDGINTTTMGVNGDILGPTLIMQKDEFVNIMVHNNIEDTTTIHWHGMHVSSPNDGGPHTIILPGDTWNPQFTVMDKAGTYWYHPHLHTKTNKHVSLGIAGFVIVKDDEEAALDLPRTYGVDDFPLVIQTKEFDAQKQIIVPTNHDDVVMVNATIDAKLDVPAQIIRFRLLNGSSQRVFNVGLSGNKTFYMIGSDGGLLNEPVPLTRLSLAPGERAEILIDFNNMQGEQVYLKSYASEFQNGIYGAANPGMGQNMTLNGYKPNPLNGTDFDILRFDVVAQNDNPVTSVPSSLVDVTPYPEGSADENRQLTFTPSQMGMDQLNHPFLINGVSFDMDVINFSIPLNNTEIWTLKNQSAIAHPFHIHDVQFYVLDRNGVAPSPSEQGRKDVILVKPQETVRFITKFEDFANDSVPYMMHCHMLVHEDQGMMLQFEVIDNTTGIENIKNDDDGFILYPNPVTGGRFTLKTDNNSNISSYELYGITGEIILKRIVNTASDFDVDVSNIPSGLYFFKVYTGNKMHTQKIIIN